MLYDNVVSNELVCACIIIVPVLCMYVYKLCVHAYSCIVKYRKHIAYKHFCNRDRVVHTVAHSACTKEPVIGQACADLLEELYSGKYVQ
jgi:hypothetical protein